MDNWIAFENCLNDCWRTISRFSWLLVTYHLNLSRVNNFFIAKKFNLFLFFQLNSPPQKPSAKFFKVRHLFMILHYSQREIKHWINFINFPSPMKQLSRIFHPTRRHCEHFHNKFTARCQSNKIRILITPLQSRFCRDDGADAAAVIEEISWILHFSPLGVSIEEFYPHTPAFSRNEKRALRRGSHWWTSLWCPIWSRKPWNWTQKLNSSLDGLSKGIL